MLPIAYALSQVFSSEDWPNILYNATAAEALDGQAWISAVFISGWFLFANFILLQMFIAVINEGFAIAEEEKHKAQVQALVKQTEPQAPTVNWISRINPYRFIKARPGILTVDNLPTNPALPRDRGAIPNYMSTAPTDVGRARHGHGHAHQSSGTFISSLKRAAVRKNHTGGADTKADPTNRDASVSKDSAGQWDVGRQL